MSDHDGLEEVITMRGMRSLKRRGFAAPLLRFLALQSGVKLRYFIDPSTGQPHIYGHKVTEAEVEDVLARPIENRSGSEGSRVALGQTEAGRYLKAIYVPDPEPGSIFVRT